MDSSSYREPGGKLTGLDIGTGASCIYPLLGAAQRPWRFVGTGETLTEYCPARWENTDRCEDIDSSSLDYARENVQLNDLEDRIRLVGRKPSDPMIPLDDLGLSAIDFVMTNPPIPSKTTRWDSRSLHLLCFNCFTPAGPSASL